MSTALPVAHEERAHSILGASSSSRWLNCPGSVSLSAAVPERGETGAPERLLITRSLTSFACSRIALRARSGSRFSIASRISVVMSPWPAARRASP